MRAQHFELGKLVEHTLENQFLQRNRCVQRIADHIRQPAIALEPGGQLGRALRMNKEHHAQLLRLGQHGVVDRVAEVIAGHAAAYGRAFQAMFADGVIEHLHGQVGKLHRQRSKGRQTLRVIGAQLGEAFVVDAANRLGGLAVLFVPKGIDAQHLQVDAHAVHGFEAGVQLLRHLQEMLRHTFDRRQNSLGIGTHQVQPGLEIAVRVRVHRACALAANDHRRTAYGGAAPAPARHDRQARAAAKPKAVAALRV